MKHYYLIILLALIVSCTIENSNPILSGFNEPPDFKILQPSHIVEARQTAERNLSSMLETFKAVPDDARTFENTVAALDDLYDQIDQVESPVEFMQIVHPDEAVRETAARESDHLKGLIHALNHDRDIYRAVKAYSQTEEAKTLTGSKRKLLADILLDFRRHGLDLPPEEAESVHELMAEADQLGMTFFRNAQSAHETLHVSENQLTGLSINSRDFFK